MKIPLRWSACPQDTIIFPGAECRAAFRLPPEGLQHAAGGSCACPGVRVIGETFSHGNALEMPEVWVDDEPRLIERQHILATAISRCRRTSARCCFYPAKKNISTRCRANGSAPSENYATRSRSSVVGAFSLRRQPDLPAGDARHLAVASPFHHQKCLFARVSGRHKKRYGTDPREKTSCCCSPPRWLPNAALRAGYPNRSR